MQFVLAMIVFGATAFISGYFGTAVALFALAVLGFTVARLLAGE